MNILPCAAPSEILEPAPLTDLSIHMDTTDAVLSAFWGGDDAYFVRADGSSGSTNWYRIEAEVAEANSMTASELLALGIAMKSVLPMSAGRVAFPVGSSGRTVYRIWRSKNADSQGRTKIRAVRAARSRRQPA